MKYFLPFILILITLNVYGSIDTSYYTIAKDSVLAIAIDTTQGSSDLDSIYFCNSEDPSFGDLTHEANEVNFEYLAFSNAGVDTLCSVVSYISGELDTATYIISVLPSMDTIDYSLNQNEIQNICFVNEVGEIDFIEVCDEVYGSLANVDSLNLCLDYISPPFPISDTFCLIAYGTNGLIDTSFVSIEVASLPTSIIVQSEFFIDEDPGYGNAYPVSMTSDSVLNLDIYLDIDSLTQGVHTLGFRSKDNFGQWSYTQTHLFFHYKNSEFNGLSYMEYFFDEDPGHGNGYFLPSSNDTLIDYSTNIDISELTTGLHTLYVRTRNNLSQWGFPASLTFFKLGGELVSGNIVAMEYFIDEDPGLAMATPISIVPHDSLDFTFNVDLSNVSIGFHSMSIRAKLENGFWSHLQSHSFLVVENSINEKDIVELEYFFDINPGNGNGIEIPITPNDTLDLVAPISLSGLSVGTHDLIVRAKDVNNLWSMLYRHEVEVTESDMLFPQVDYFPSGISMTASNCYDGVQDSFYIINTGNNTLNFNIEDEVEWLTYSQLNGSVPQGDSILISVEANPMGLTSSQNLVDVHIYSNAETSPDTIASFNLNVPQSNYSLKYSENLVQFEDTQINTSTQESIVITNTSCHPIQIDSVLTTNVVFVSAVWDSLVLENDSLFLELSFLPELIDSFEDSLFVFSQAGIDTLFIEAESFGVPIINFEQDSLAIEFTSCAIDTSLEFFIKNDGTGPLQWEYLSDQMPSWTSLNIASDTLQQADSTLVVLSINQTGLTVGSYIYNLEFASNDTLQALALLPLRIDVIGDANLTCSDDQLDCGSISRNTEITIGTNILNEGCNNLIISSIGFNSNVFTTNVSSVFLPPSYSYPIYVTFEPPYAGTFIDTMTVVSDVGILKVPIVGVGEGALTQELSDLSFDKTIQSCQGMYVDSLFIYNVGDGPGDWNIINAAVQPDWISISSTNGSLIAGDSSLVEISYDATGLISQTYSTELNFEFSDPITPNILVPVTMHATGGAQMSIEKDAIDFGYSYFTRFQKDTIQLINTGCDTFHVQDVSHDFIFELSDTVFNVLPFDTFEIVAKFKPDMITSYLDTLEFNGLTDTLFIEVSGEGLDIPKILKFTNDSLIIQMPSDVLATTVSENTWRLWGEKTGLRSGSYNIQNGDQLIFEPDVLFRAGEEISMSIFEMEYLGSKKVQAYNIVTKAPVYNPTNAVFKVLPIQQMVPNVYASSYLYYSDVNKDNLVDILVVENSPSLKLDIYFQHANGGFNYNATYNSSSNGLYLETTPDINNDGFPDLLFAQRHSTGVFGYRLNNGDGSFGSFITIFSDAKPVSAIGSDWDADGDIDVLSLVTGQHSGVGLQIKNYNNDGTGGFSLQSSLDHNVGSVGFAVSDYDKNGYQDLIYQTIKNYDQFKSYKNEAGEFSIFSTTNTPTEGYFNNYFVGDLNQDLSKDILFSEYSNMYVLFTDSLEFPEYSNKVLIRDEIGRTRVEDLNGDGLNDILLFDHLNGNDWENHPVELALNNASHQFNFEDRGFQAGKIHSLNSCDIDNDGDIDFPFIDSLGQLWIGYNEDSNAEISFSQDSIIAQFISCNVDTSFNFKVFNTGDSTLVWHHNQNQAFPTWMSIDTTNGQILSADSLELNLGINTSNLLAGLYEYNLLFASNDTSSYQDHIHIQFEIISDTLLSISSLELDFGLVDTSQVYNLNLDIINDGCEDVNIDSSFIIGSIFEVNSLPAIVSANDSYSITVSITPEELLTYTDTLVLTHDYGAFVIPLSATGCYLSPESVIQHNVCDIESVGLDTLFLLNESGCDSTIVTINSIESPISNDSIILSYLFSGDANDFGGRDFHGIINGATLTENRFGEVGNSMNFDGFNDWINANPVLNKMETGMDISMSFWFNTTDSPSQIHGNIIASANLFGGPSENVFRLGTTQIGGIFLSPDSGTYFEMGTGFNDGIWHHLVMTINGSNSFLELFVDGIKVGEASDFYVDWTRADRFNIGHEYDGSATTDFYSGKLDQFRIYERIIDAEEVQQLFHEISLEDYILYAQDTLIDFDVLTVGDSLSITTIVSNSTCNTISFDSIYVTHPAYKINYSSSVLLPYQSAIVEIQFLPDTSLLFTSELRLESELDSVSIDLIGLGCNATPMLSYTDTTSICSGEYFTLTTDQNISLTWSNGYQGDTLLVNESGTYYGILSNGNGCILYTDSVEVIKLPDPYIINHGVSTLCVGDSTLLEVLHSETQYWSTGESNDSIWVHPIEDEIYVVTASNDLGCTFTDSVLINVIPPVMPGLVTNMVPYDGTIDEGQSVLFSWLPADNASTYDLYLWLNTDVKPSLPTVSNLNQISTTINYLELGRTYKWQIHSKNSCFESEGPQQIFETKFLPDLIVQNVTVPNSAFSGTSITVSWEIKNIGDGDTGSQVWFDKVGLSEDNYDHTGGVDPLMASDVNVSALSPNQSYTNTATFTLPEGISGNYFIFIRTDASNNLIEELDESNNNNQFGAYIPINLTPPPDLKVINSIEPNNTFSGQSIQVQFTVKNDGTGSTLLPYWQDRIYISEDSIRNGNDFLLKTTTHTGVLLDDESYTELVDIDIPINLEGAYYLIYETDAIDNIYEFIYEDNNEFISQALNIFQTPPADLVPLNLAVPDTLHSNELINVSWEIQNLGANPTNVSNWRDKLYLTKGDTFALSESILVKNQYHNGVLEIDSSYLVSSSARVPKDIDSTYNFFLLTDQENNLVEVFDSNNIFGPIPCFIKTPDLAVDSFHFNQEVLAGEKTVLNYKLENIGEGKLIERSVNDKIFASIDQVLDPGSDIFLGDQSSIISLDIGESIYRNYEIAFDDGTMDSFYLFVVTDHSDIIYEDSLELNNTGLSDSTIVVTLPDYPDLKAVELLAPDTIQAASSFSIEYRVENVGLSSVLDQIWKDKLYLSTDSILNMEEPMDISIGTKHVNQDLESGQDYSFTLSSSLPENVSTGYYYILLSVDAENKIYEHDKESNNLSLRLDSIYVEAYPDSDLEISASSNLPDVIYSGMEISVDLVVTNLGDGTANDSPWMDQLYFSNDTNLDGDDILLNTNNRVSALEYNESYNVSINAMVPDGVNGPFYFLAVTDVQNENGETNTSNNVAIITSQGGIGGNGSEGDSTIVQLSPYPDLELISLFSSPSVTEGQAIELIYTVQNNGDTAIVDRVWNDRVYLSPDTNPGGLHIYNNPIAKSLAVGESYHDTLQIDIPLNNIGNFFVVINSDANNSIYEHLSEDNNHDAVLLTVYDSPPADAFVDNITCALDTTQNGDQITVEWETKNLGLNPITGSMHEAVYFSQDTVWDVSDPLMYSSQIISNIAPLGKKDRSESFDVENAPFGFQYIIVRTDLKDNIDEVEEENNISIGEQIFVDINVLPIDVLTADVLEPNKNLFYRVEVVDSLSEETLKITLEGDTLLGYNESYVSFDDLPSRFDYQYSHSDAFMGKQQVIVPDIEEGNYFNLSYGTTASNGNQDVSLLAEIQPFEIFKVIADEGSNTGQTTVKIEGARFEEGMTAILCNDSLENVLHAYELVFLSPTDVYASFDLTAGDYTAYNQRNGLDTGYYDLKLIKQDGTLAVLEDGFHVHESVNNNIRVNVIYPDQIRPFRTAPIQIEYANISGKDIPVPKFLVVSLENVPVGRTESELKTIDGWAWGQNLPLGYREVLIELRDPENEESEILRAGQEGIVTIYAWIQFQGQYSFKIIDLK